MVPPQKMRISKVLLQHKSKKVQLGLLLSAILFVVTQFASILYGMEFIASLADNDVLDDISLEDIVVMDPFLAGNTSGSAYTIKLGDSGEDIPLIAQSASIVCHLQPCDFPAFVGGSTRLDRYHAITRFPNDSWQTNRVLLI